MKKKYQITYYSNGEPIKVENRPEGSGPLPPKAMAGALHTIMVQRGLSHTHAKAVQREVYSDKIHNVWLMLPYPKDEEPASPKLYTLQLTEDELRLVYNYTYGNQDEDLTGVSDEDYARLEDKETDEFNKRVEELQNANSTLMGKLDSLVPIIAENRNIPEDTINLNDLFPDISPKLKAILDNDLETVDMAYLDIMAGAGWASDDYIINFIHLPPVGQLELMIRLAEQGLLFDEDAIPIEEAAGGEIPTSGAYTVERVKATFKHLKAD